MAALDVIKSKIQNLYQTNPNIHINVAVTHPKVNRKNEPVVIRGVYPHIFQIEERSSGSPKLRTIPYTEVLLHYADILELEEC